ncbi:MAG: relaxase/mobilization nuclease domain-containing protein [Proteobacteria bacterium]|nr:relaxase/mobilization nuclease domain-containing protein [Pseudomonadota bacterium]
MKVTGGGRNVGAVAAHIAYISHHGGIELETDDGQRVSKAGQKELLNDWHLDLSAGQYRPAPRSAKNSVGGIKLVHNIVLSMPAPTPSDKVLAAAKTFAREKFGLKYRYAMALHTHQRHPHVHLVVKAESLDAPRLHIDKAMLREWRQDFARMMRDHGISANATPRAVRGHSKGAERDCRYRTRRRGSSFALRETVEGIARELATSGTIRDPAHTKLIEARKAIVAGWLSVAALLDHQGDAALAGEVRQYVGNLPPVLTDRERIAVELARHARTQRPVRTRADDVIHERTPERTR